MAYNLKIERIGFLPEMASTGSCVYLTKLMEMRDFRRLACIFLLLLTVGFCQAQNVVDYATIDEYIEKAVADFEVPGMAVGIIKDGEIVFAKGYGTRLAGTEQKVDEHSLFGIASLSKAFTAAALGKLVEQGHLKWDDKVVEYLPNFKLHDEYVTKNLTIADLLSHRSGLATFDGDLLWYSTSYSRKEVIKRIQHLPLKHGFRAEFGYQNIMFMTAGEIIEKITGETWDMYIYEEFFEPIGMDESNTSNLQTPKDAAVAMPHVDGKPVPVINWDNSGPAASINSNVDDLLLWAKMWLGKGQIDGTRILSEKTVNQLWAAQTTESVSSFDEFNGIHFKAYALGWHTFDYSGRKVVQHDGGLPGYISKLTLIPEENLGIVILANDMTWLNGALTYRILDLHMNSKDRDWAAEYLTYYKNYRKREAAKIEARNAERDMNTNRSFKDENTYVGTFRDKMYGDATVEMVKGNLVLTLLPTKELFTAKLEHWENDTYRFKFNDPFLPEGFINFEVDKDQGTIPSFKIDLANPDLHFSNLHFKRIK